jgi:hypothetical protein
LRVCALSIAARARERRRSALALDTIAKMQPKNETI